MFLQVVAMLHIDSGTRARDVIRSIGGIDYRMHLYGDESASALSSLWQASDAYLIQIGIFFLRPEYYNSAIFHHTGASGFMFRQSWRPPRGIPVAKNALTTAASVLLEPASRFEIRQNSFYEGLFYFTGFAQFLMFQLNFANC